MLSIGECKINDKMIAEILLHYEWPHLRKLDLGIFCKMQHLTWLEIWVLLLCLVNNGKIYAFSFYVVKNPHREQPS